jgi:putative radical SAM enzyme (TIGR03279 family)
MSRPGGWIEAVEPGSAGEAAGLLPGDRLLSINDHPLRDVIDVQFYGAEEQLSFVVERHGMELGLETSRGYAQALGLSFTHPTFDVDIRRCANNCDFCFVKQNAPGMRRSLYVKDDDYRYSFLFGNFVTLTNLTADDWARVKEQRLSPLYVSVHASELELRRRFLGRPLAPDVMEQLRRLGGLGIEVHTQVVLVPGLNDGEHLERTVADLARLFEAPVASVGIVPVGLTRHHTGRCRSYTPEESRAVLDLVAPWRARFRHALGCTFVYPADEWYLVAGREIPTADAYDEFAQVENGVGMVRQLLDEWHELRQELNPGSRPRRARSVVKSQGVGSPLGPATLVCGTLIAPILAAIVADLNSILDADLRLVPVVNEFFGPVTTVSGLLTGQDVVAALRGLDLGKRAILPRAMFTGRYGAGSAPPGMTLDDRSVSDLSAELGVAVAVAGTLQETLLLLQA